MSADELPPQANEEALGPFLAGGDALAAEIEAPPPDPLTEQALRVLDQPPQRTWVQGVLLLGVTLAVFAMWGFFSIKPGHLALIVAVLLFHETGHYVGMRMFNYKDVRMFFIPFFGAAVSGRSTSVEGYKEGIVLLLGPLPGIVLGIVLGIVGIVYETTALRTATFMLLAINGFNLLPLLPLDGGRLVHLVLFSRQRHLEALFRIVTALLLGLVALLLGAWLLGLLAVFMLLGTNFTFKISTLAQRLRGVVDPAQSVDLSNPIPREWAVPLVERVRQAFPPINQPATLANITRQVWERMHVQPPGLITSMLLLTIYTGTFFATPIAMIALHRPPAVAPQIPDADAVEQDGE